MNPTLQDQLSGVRNTATEIQDVASNLNSGASGSRDPISSALEKTLLANAELISSSNSGIENAIGRAIQGIRGSQEASASRINNDINQQQQSVLRTGLIQQTDMAEGRRGFATQTAVLRNILDTTNDDLKQLETRRQDLLASGEAEAASQIAQMQVSSIQMAQQAKQNAIQNMIGLSNQLFQQQRINLDTENAEFSRNLDRIATLQKVGTLQNTDPETLGNLERAAGLPSGALTNVSDVPPDYEIRTMGNSLLAIDPADPTNVKVIYTAPASGGAGRQSPALSIRDTQALGLPLSLAGLTEETVVNSLAESSAPEWYREAERATTFGPIQESSLNQKWNSYRASLLRRTGVPETGGNWWENI